MNKYRTTDPRRYEPLECIPKSTPGQNQLPAPASLQIEDRVKFQIAATSWEEKGFQEKMSELVGFFNASGEACEATFEFEDPFFMALLFEVLNTKFKVVGIKNKYLQPTFKESPELHLNLDLGNGWLVEVQMLFRDILAIKKEDHKFYDVKRASSPWDVPDRLLKVSRTPPTSSTPRSNGFTSSWRA